MPRVSVEYRTAGKNVYEKFCKLHPDVKVSFEDWKKVIYTFNELFREYVLESGDKVKMPQGLGPFAVNKKKKKPYKNFKDKNGNAYVNLAIDWGRTKKIGKKVYHMNAHTDGYSYKWLWFGSDARFFLSSIWTFTASRETSRLLGSLLKKPNSHHAQLYKTWTLK